MGDEPSSGGALAVRRALARGPAAPGPAEAVRQAEARLRAALEEVTAEDAAVEALSLELDAFSRTYERTLGEPFADLAAAERLARRIQALEDGLAQLAAGLADGTLAKAPRRKRARRGGVAGRHGRRGEDPEPDDDGVPGVPAAEGAADDARDGDGEPGAAEPPEIEPAALAAKRLYRRLARVLHPDLASDDLERVRLGDLMARVNAAYAKGDLTALEVMAERVGAGEPPGELSDAERLVHLGTRAAGLERIAASLARERARLEASDTARLRSEARRRAEAGGDLVAETRAELAEEAAAAYADALARLGRLEKAARAVARAREQGMGKLVKRGPTGARRVFDPLQESGLVRAGAARLERSRATADARALARRLEELAPGAPWEVALAVLALLAEDAGARAPEALAQPELLAARWEALRAGWPGAPDLPRALARMPRHLVIGARQTGGAVAAGLQLAAPDLAAGVRIALEHEAVAAVGRAVLAALGPEVTCAHCGETGPGRHLLRTRGLDERHGIACAACGEVQRSYWRYGEVDGLEALAPHALRLGLVAEVTAELAGTAVGFQMLPAEREALSAAGLRRRFTELYLAPYEVELGPETLGVAAARGALGPGARLAGEGQLHLTLEPGGAPAEAALLELLRARIERRFRP